jgi:hypothetical protein
MYAKLFFNYIHETIKTRVKNLNLNKTIIIQIHDKSIQ